MKSYNLAAAAICLTVALLGACSAYPETHMSVKNIIADDTINVHCFSGDDDLGYHNLATNQAFTWSFHYSLITQTQFFCTIRTRRGSGSYMVYGRDIATNRCGNNCNWEVQLPGPCLRLSRGGVWCQNWNK